jgi:probable addiction module antidote protein
MITGVETIPRSRDYREGLLERLKDSRQAVAYLNAALEDDDRRVFLLALKDVTDARGGMTKLSASAKLNREGLYKALSEKGNPELASLTAMLRSLGLSLAVKQTGAKRTTGRRKAKAGRVTPLRIGENNITSGR